MGLPARRSGTGGLPGWDAANSAYVRISDPQLFKRFVGGHVDDTHGGDEWLTDTCTLRLSRAFNYAGRPIPQNAPGLRTVHGRDKLNYAYAVKEFREWTRARFGPPNIEVAGPPVSRQQFAGYHGLIIFDIKFGNNPGMNWGATGHADLWDGTTFYDELWGISTPSRDFFTLASRISLWLMTGTGKVTL